MDGGGEREGKEEDRLDDVTGMELDTQIACVEALVLDDLSSL